MCCCVYAKARTHVSVALLCCSADVQLLCCLVYCAAVPLFSRPVAVLLLAVLLLAVLLLAVLLLAVLLLAVLLLTVLLLAVLLLAVLARRCCSPLFLAAVPRPLSSCPPQCAKEDPGLRSSCCSTSVEVKTISENNKLALLHAIRY